MAEEQVANPPAIDPAANDTPAEQVYEYQVTDENKQPVGRPVRIKYRTQDELIKGMEKANAEAVLAYHRLKSAKPTSVKPEAPAPKPMTADEEYQAGLELQNPATAGKAVRKLIENQIPLSEIERESKEARKSRANADAEAAMYAFCRSHVTDFYDCHANGKILGEYLRDNQLAVTSDNLEIAFAATQDRLAANPSVTALPPQTEDNPPAERTRQAATGIMPGEFRGNRTPAQRKPGLTKKDIGDMRKTPEGREEFRRRMANPAQRAEIERVLAGS